MDFVHLHVHTEYSLLDGASRIDDLLEEAIQKGMHSIAITDHGVMHGVVQFYKKAKKKGLHPILGCEVYMAKRTRFDRDPERDRGRYHLILLAENNQGYQNLMKLVSHSFTEGFYYKPRIDEALLRQYHEGLICTSACIGGEIPSKLLSGDREGAYEAARKMKEIFGPHHFYIELQDFADEAQQRANKMLIELAKDLNIPLICSNDVHYTRKEDAPIHDVLLCIQTAATIDEKDRMRFPADTFYLKSPAEMEASFGAYPEALQNTVEIAKRCQVTLDFDHYHLPEFKAPTGYTNEAYLKKLVYEGLAKRYERVTESLKERTAYELSVIIQMGYVEYFLIVWDFISFAKKNNIMVGPGRGSAAGSLVSYCLFITDVDPIQYGLIFERFLNPERVSMPDIDIDFCYERREEVIQYVIEKYGEDKVAQIVTFGTMAARAAIRDVGRAMNISYKEVDYVAKQVPMEIGMTIEKALQISPSLRKVYEEDENLRALIDTSQKVEGMPRHTSTHAAGIVISKNPLDDYVPLCRNNEVIATQFTMTELEELGLLKMDFLGLRNLTIIQDALFLIEKNNKEVPSFEGATYDDAKVYEIFAKGDTLGVFQFESSGIRQFLKELKPTGIEDIIAANALYRPGPMKQIPTFVANKNGHQKIRYIHPLLAPILGLTYGCMVYQEQVMQIFRDIGGYSMGRSDLVRRAMSKKKMDVMEQERQHFIYGMKDETGKIIISGAIQHGVPKEAANQIYDLMIDFANYAFNKSHSAAYSMLAYQTAYLKVYYPVEFMAALLSSVMGRASNISLYIREAKRLGVSIMPPDINRSYDGFTVEQNQIRFGLGAIKNVGKGVIEDIVAARKKEGDFVDFQDFLEKTDTTQINKRAVESMIKAGIFDSLGAKRAQLMAIYEKVMERVISGKKKNILGQVSLFEAMGEKSIDKIPLPDLPEFDEKILLDMEKEMMGIYISGHPLADYEKELESYANTNIQELNELMEAEESVESSLKDGAYVKLGGLIDSKKTMLTKNNRMMAFCTLEDLYGSMEIIVFPKVYERYQILLEEDALILVEGRLSVSEEEVKLLAERFYPLKKERDEKLYLKLSDFSNTALLSNLKTILKHHEGHTPVILYEEKSQKSVVADKVYWVDLENDGLMEDLRDILPEEYIKVR